MHALHATDAGAERHSLTPLDRDELQCIVEELPVEQLRLRESRGSYIKQHLDIGRWIRQFQLLRQDVVEIGLLRL